MDKCELLELTKKFNQPNSFSKCVYQTIEFINQNYFTELSLDAISKSVRYNKYYICRAFKQETGFTIQNVVTAMRIEKAKQLLKETNLPLSDVVFMCGFSSQSYFCYMFKKAVGKTPLRYMKEHRSLPH